ncbi:MAG: hypothetical protein EZS28_015897 [Streblomastix strix]|uniref:Uncharacterized protein n=1 Tax=Streblomastix strix TaxID=222440 RepID=A0A5J4W167_9EUKA|nr:MAG: hypothetical protein EZS28_015897 [Streblomastix strix]
MLFVPQLDSEKGELKEDYDWDTYIYVQAIFGLELFLLFNIRVNSGVELISKLDYSFLLLMLLSSVVLSSILLDIILNSSGVRVGEMKKLLFRATDPGNEKFVCECESVDGTTELDD